MEQPRPHADRSRRTRSGARGLRARARTEPERCRMPLEPFELSAAYGPAGRRLAGIRSALAAALDRRTAARVRAAAMARRLPARRQDDPAARGTGPGRHAAVLPLRDAGRTPWRHGAARSPRAADAPAAKPRRRWAGDR